MFGFEKRKQNARKVDFYSIPSTQESTYNKKNNLGTMCWVCNHRPCICNLVNIED